jgi:hypothetical protein
MNYMDLIKIIIAICEEISILVFGAHLKGPYFSELECSYLQGTDLWWKVQNVNKIGRTAQALARGIFIYTGDFPIPHLSYSGRLKTCKSVEISRSIIFTITVLSHIYYLIEGRENINECIKNTARRS